METKTVEELIKEGSKIFENQFIKLTKDKVIAPYSTVEYYRMVLDMQKRCIDGNKLSEDELEKAQLSINFAIDHAKVNDLPIDDLESLKNDINYLKYNLI